MGARAVAVEGQKPRILVVGAGALGSLLATRLAAAGEDVAVAVRDDADAAALRASGLHVTGMGGDASWANPIVAPLWAYEACPQLLQGAVATASIHLAL